MGGWVDKGLCSQLDRHTRCTGQCMSEWVGGYSDWKSVCASSICIHHSSTYPESSYPTARSRWMWASWSGKPSWTSTVALPLAKIMVSRASE